MFVLGLAALLSGCGGGSSSPPPSPTIASITVSPSTASLLQAQSQQFTATAKDSNGNTMSNVTFTWASDNTSVATVSTQGNVTAVVVGSAHITAASGGITGSSSVTVVSNIRTVAVSPTSATISVGQTQQFSAQALDSGGGVLSGKTFTWTSSNSSIATVDGTGKATGVSSGTATITATSESVSGSAQLTVTSISGVAVTIAPFSATVPVNQQELFTAAVTGSTNTAVTWTVNPGVGSCASSTASTCTYAAPASVPTPATVTITATSQADSTAVGSATITVAPASSTSNVVVMAGQAVGVNVSLAAMTPTLQFLAMGTCAGTSCTAGTTGVTLTRGSSATLFLVGNGFVSGTSYAVSGPPDVTLGPPTFAATNGTPSHPAATMSVTVSPNAATGPRNVMVRNGSGELTVFVGGLLIQ